MRTLALIGAGQWGKNFISTIKTIPNCHLKYICAQSEETLKSLSDEYIKLRDYRNLFKYSDIDGIIIATPGSTHFEIARSLLEKSYNLFIEKPLTIDYKQALELKKIYDNLSKKCVVLIGHMDLYNPAFIRLKEFIKDIGRIQYLTFEGLNNGPFRSDISVLWDWGPHGVSCALDIIKDEVKEVSAWAVNSLRPNSNLYDLVFIRLHFKNGATVFIKVSWLSPIKKREIVVVGSESSLVYDNLAPKKVIYFENIAPTYQKDNFIKREPKISYPSYSSEAALKLEILEFIKSIDNGTKPKTDLNQAIKVVKILSLVEESIRGGYSVKV